MDEGIAQSPLVNYSERDRVGFVLQAGFTNIHLEFHIDVLPPLTTSWDIFLDSSRHPWAPTPRVVLSERFTPDEAYFYERIFRPVIENDHTSSIDRVASLTGGQAGARSVVSRQRPLVYGFPRHILDACEEALPAWREGVSPCSI